MTKEHVVGHNKSNILKFQRKHYEFPSFFSMFNFRLEFRNGILQVALRGGGNPPVPPPPKWKILLGEFFRRVVEI